MIQLLCISIDIYTYTRRERSSLSHDLSLSFPFRLLTGAVWGSVDGISSNTVDLATTTLALRRAFLPSLLKWLFVLLLRLDRNWWQEWWEDLSLSLLSWSSPGERLSSAVCHWTQNACWSKRNRSSWSLLPVLPLVILLCPVSHSSLCCDKCCDDHLLGFTAKTGSLWRSKSIYFSPVLFAVSISLFPTQSKSGRQVIQQGSNPLYFALMK